MRVENATKRLMNSVLLFTFNTSVSNDCIAGTFKSQMAVLGVRVHGKRSSELFSHVPFQITKEEVYIGVHLNKGQRMVKTGMQKYM